MHTLPSPVNVVTQEQIVGLWWVSQFVKMSEQILVLAMYVSSYVHRGLQFQQHGLL